MDLLVIVIELRERNIDEIASALSIVLYVNF